MKMNILMISTNNHSLPVPVMPLGACLVTEAAERAGHYVRFLDLMFERDALRAIDRATEDLRPDVVALSVRNIDNNDMQNPMFFVRDLPAMIRAIRGKTDAPVVIGGAAVSVMPEEILRLTGVDCAVMGDGEAVFPELLKNVSKIRQLSRTPGIARIEEGAYVANPCRPPVIPEVCSVPDFRRWIDVEAYLSRLATVPLQTKLGCHFQCVYCTYRKIEGNEYRLYSPESVAQAVKKTASQGLLDIEIVDNVFNSPLDHAMEICTELARSGHSARLQSIELNPLFVDDDLLSAMAKAGFTAVGITAESASDRVLEGLRKGFSSRHVHNAAEAVRRHSLPCLWIFMLGGPGETEDTVNETLRFIEKHIRPRDPVFFNTGIRVYPGTELEEIARKQGLLAAGTDMLTPVFYLSPEIDRPWLERRIRDFRKSHMNVVGSDSLVLPFLPALHRFGYRLGVRSPIWRHTSKVRRALKYMGIYS
jgi:radical SAM superfamily enzyme YgiQ (UPF0313 family)